MGQVVASRFANLGADLVVSYLSEGEISAFQANYPEEAEKIYFERLNALDHFKVEKFINTLVKRKGAPEVLINLISARSFGKRVIDTEPSHYNEIYNINFITTLNLCRSILPHMQKNRRGHIVNLAAKAGLVGEAGNSAYSIAKSAVIRLTESLSAEVRRDGVNVNCVLPSILDTAANRQDTPEGYFPEWVSVSDVAEVITFLSSRVSRAIHGAAIPVIGEL